MIELEKVSKRYVSGQDAIRAVSLTITEGEMVFVTGRSGAGKTTFLKLLTLVERCSGGIVRYRGQDLAQLRGMRVNRYRRGIGMVFQDHRLLMDRSVGENVALPLVIGGFRRQDIERRTRAALDRVGLRGKEHLSPIALSTGEQQRVGIARAVVHRPRLLVADEPTGNLDPELSRDIVNLFHRFNQVGVTVVMATHDIHLIDFVGCRRLVLSDGELVGDSAGLPRETDDRAHRDHG